MAKPFTFGTTGCAIGFAAPMFPIQCRIFVNLAEKMGDRYEKPHFTAENFKFWELCWKIIIPRTYKLRQKREKNVNLNVIEVILLSN